MATIKFRIVDTVPEDRQIIVRFFSDVLTESELGNRAQYAISLPVPAPEGDELRAFIMSYCPVDWFETMHRVRDPSTPTPMPLLAIGQVIDGTAPLVEPTLDELRAAKNAEINAWRASANLSTFPYAGKLFSCDTVSRSDIDGVANHIGLFGTFPDGFPGAWRALDNSMHPLPDVDAFRALFAGMAAQGTENFNYSQRLKAQLDLATTSEEIAAIVW